MRQRKIDRESHRRFVRPQPAQLRNLFFVGFATDNDQHASRAPHLFAQRDPILNRPVLRFAPASGMNRDDWSFVSTKKFLRCFSVAFVRKEKRGRIDQRQSEFLQRVAPVDGQRVRVRQISVTPQ